MKDFDFQLTKQGIFINSILQVRKSYLTKFIKEQGWDIEYVLSTLELDPFQRIRIVWYVMYVRKWLCTLVMSGRKFHI